MPRKQQKNGKLIKSFTFTPDTWALIAKHCMHDGVYSKGNYSDFIEMLVTQYDLRQKQKLAKPTSAVVNKLLGGRQ